MPLKICYCIKANNNVIMTFWRICHYAEQYETCCNAISIFNVNVILTLSKISALSKSWWAKKAMQLKYDHFT